MYHNFSILYILIYFAIGSLYPLLAKYFETIHISGTQTGIIMSAGSVVTIFALPLWGFLCDKTQKIKQVLKVTIFLSIITVLVLSRFKDFYLLLPGFAVLHLFQSANGPISDSIVLSNETKSSISFGRIRQWGAAGFGIAVLTAGFLGEQMGLQVIFYLYAAAYFCAFFLIKALPDSKARVPGNILKGLRILLVNYKYSLFLISAFFVLGPVNANNIYFGLLFQKLGSSLSGIGIAFLLFTWSEAPFMKLTNRAIKKWGMEYTLIFAASVSALRWFWYSTAPSYALIFFLFFIQGISVGFFIVAGAQYVRENASEEMQVTAMTIYSSVGLGLGSIASQLSGGIIIDYYSILHAYRFFGVSTVLGIIPLLFIKFYFRCKTPPL